MMATEKNAGHARPAGGPGEGPKLGGSDKRAHVRQRSLLTGKLVFNHGWGALDCTVRDISAGGAKVQLGGWPNLPKEIELYLERGQRFRCEVVRFVDNFMCLRFLDRLARAS